MIKNFSYIIIHKKKKDTKMKLNHVLHTLDWIYYSHNNNNNSNYKLTKVSMNYINFLLR